MVAGRLILTGREAHQPNSPETTEGLAVRSYLCKINGTSKVACNADDAVQHATNLQPLLGIQTENTLPNTKFGKFEPTQAAKLICKCRCVS